MTVMSNDLLRDEALYEATKNGYLFFLTLVCYPVTIFYHCIFITSLENSQPFDNLYSFRVTRCLFRA